MRFPLAGALLLGAAFGSLAAAPPKKPAKAMPSRPLADIPAAGASGELLDLESGRSRAIGPMQESRTDFQATVFPDGRALITGGSLKGGSTEWFDPATRRFSAGPAMTQTRQGHRALLLKDGRLLILGGTEAPAPAEILEVGAPKFQPLPGDCRFALSAEAVETEEGVLLIDGQEGKCWLWDGKAKNPKSTGSLGSARILFSALRLKDGRVLVTGGWPASPQPERRGFRRPAPSRPASVNLPAEVFTPRKGRWNTWKAAPLPRAHHQMILQPDGRVLLLGGFGATAEAPEASLEILDPAKESVMIAGKLATAELPAPGWAEVSGRGLFLPERSAAPRWIPGLEDWAAPGAQPLHLANAYLAPALLPLKDRQLLVLGSAVWGPALERWDPRTRQCQYLGALRSGTESLALLDGKVVALGPIVDSLDPKTGNLTPLGWRADLAPLLKRMKTAANPSPTTPPPFPAGQAFRDSLVVSLDAQRALVLGGRSEESPEGTDQVWVWDLKKKTLTPSGPMRAKRAFPVGASTAQGGLRLGDGSVLIWSVQ
jgi:hypothetical protein